MSLDTKARLLTGALIICALGGIGIIVFLIMLGVNLHI